MTCTHDIVERDVAVTADGYCPLCLAAEIERWRGLWDDQMREKNVLKIENERLTAGNAAVDAQFRVWRERAEKAEAEIERRRTELEQEIAAHDITRAENERLRGELAYCPRDMQVADGMIRDLRAEIEQLKVLLQRERGELHAVRAANVQLTAALRDATGLDIQP